MYIYMADNVCIWLICVYMLIYVYRISQLCQYIYMYIYMCVYVCVCLHKYIYIYALKNMSTFI